jgi:hypothetical protein
MLDQDEVRSMRALLPPAVAPRMDAIVETLNRRTLVTCCEFFMSALTSKACPNPQTQSPSD